MSLTQRTTVVASASAFTGSSFSNLRRCQRQQQKRQIGGFGFIIGDNALRRYGSGEEQQHKQRFESMKTRAKKTTKKKGSGGGGYGGGNSTGFSQDWANYGSFDESYFEDADTMYKPSQMFNTSKSKRKSGAQNVLEILAEERKQRRAQNYVKYEEDNWDEEEEEEYWDEEEEEEYYEEEEEYANASASSRAGSMGSVESKPKPTKPNNPPAKRAPPPAPKPKSTPPPPKPKPKPQPVKNETPEEAKAKATKTLLKWGFQDEDIAEAMKNASDGSTAKQMQIQVLDYLLETAPLENIPQEYLMDAKQRRM
jgi:hypothetical protein